MWCALYQRHSLLKEGSLLVVLHRHGGCCAHQRGPTPFSVLKAGKSRVSIGRNVARVALDIANIDINAFPIETRRERERSWCKMRKNGFK